MLTFNQLLEKAGVLPEQTRLVRHQGQRGPLGRSPADLWRAADGSFERYQSFQSGPVFGNSTHLASFVPGYAGETLFVGLYGVTGKAVVTDPAMTCPIGGHSVIDHDWYTSDRISALDAYVGRLVIDWGRGTRSWVQRADRQDKPILEVRKRVAEPDYPGHIHFLTTISALADVPDTWKSNLQNSRGVYLLISSKSGQQYVGSATGSEGFWGRWMAYAKNGHGDNKLMKRTADGDYQVSILEVASSSATGPEILRLEALWMRKLGTTMGGLNSAPGRTQDRT